MQPNAHPSSRPAGNACGFVHRANRVGDRLESHRHCSTTCQQEGARTRSLNDRPEMGTLLAIDTSVCTIVASIVSRALRAGSRPSANGDSEIWIAEVGLVGELMRKTTEKGKKTVQFNRGVTAHYPALSVIACAWRPR